MSCRYRRAIVHYGYRCGGNWRVLGAAITSAVGVRLAGRGAVRACRSGVHTGDADNSSSGDGSGSSHGCARRKQRDGDAVRCLRPGAEMCGDKAEHLAEGWSSVTM